MINLVELNLKICGFYRSPSTTYKIFFDILDDLLEKNENMICLGDANINLLNNDDKIKQHYYDIIETNNYDILNNIQESDFTYRVGNHTSILDHILSDKALRYNDHEIQIEDISFSDHRFIHFKYKLQIEQKKNRTKEIISTNYVSIVEELNSFDYRNYCYEEFGDFFSNIIKKHSNTKKITIKKNNKQEAMDRFRTQN